MTRFDKFSALQSAVILISLILLMFYSGLGTDSGPKAENLPQNTHSDADLYVAVIESVARG